MKVLTGDYRTWERHEAPTWCTIGVFDGVHRGHQAIIATLAELAGGGDVAVITFRDHPLDVLQPDAAPPMLASLEQRLDVFDQIGVALVAVLEFGLVRELSPRAFVADIVAGVLNTAHVAVGHGFRFGHNGAGDENVLRRLGIEFGFDVAIVDIVGGENPVSSTAIRDALAAGRVADAAAMLGRPFQLRGGVIQGDQRGRQLGFPTANMEIEKRRAIPGRGVYSALTMYSDGAVHDSVVNIGVRPTFGESIEVVEVHLLDADVDLYGQELSVDFIERIRPERRFSGVEELVEQIGRDVDTARIQIAAHRS